MLLTKEVEVNVNTKYVKYYQEKGYTIPKRINKNNKLVIDTSKTIKVKIEDLPSNSHAIINYKCDFCGRLISTRYQAYNKKDEDGCIDCYNKNKIKKSYIFNKQNIINIIKEKFKDQKIIYSNDILNYNRSLYNACVREFGNIENAVIFSGFTYESMRRYWDKQMVIDTIKKMYLDGCDLNDHAVNKYNNDLYNASRKIFKTWKNAIEKSDLTYSKIKKGHDWSKQKILDVINKRVHNGQTIESNAIIKELGGIVIASRRIFGSWRKAVELCGIDYDSILKTKNIHVYAGLKFEKMVGDILLELGVSHRKNLINNLKPDYVFTDTHWGDAKLSEWTIEHCDTIKKYQPHTKFITIIFLRGDEEKDVIIEKNVRLISVYKYIKQLPKHRKKYYENKFNKIFEELNTYEKLQNIAS